MESLGTRPTEFVNSRSPQMLRLSNQMIRLVVQRPDNVGGREGTVLSQYGCRTNKVGALLAIALVEIARSSAGRRISGATFGPADLRRCNKPTIHSESELLRVYEFP